MRRPSAVAKPRVSTLSPFAAPSRGWVANENLAVPAEGGAAVLENWFPTATGVRMRAGSETYATLGDGNMPTRSLFSYLNGPISKLFGATDEAVYDITAITTPINYTITNEGGLSLSTDDDDTFGEDSTNGLEVITGQGGGYWVTVQFATAGGVFLVGVNGENDAFIFDGTTFYPLGDSPLYQIKYDTETVPFTEGETLTGGTSGATATILRVLPDGETLWLVDLVGAPFQDNETITDGDGGAALADGANTLLWGGITGVSPSALSYVWIYKSRAWFVEKDSLNAWYLPVDQVSGAATKFPLGGVFGLGGSLMFGATWSLDSGAEGGLSEQCVFVSTEGEVAVYQGTDPNDAADWKKVGVYRIGRPLGPKAHIRAGGDLVIATDIGFVPLSQAIQRDVAALSPGAVSYAIETAWNERVENHSPAPWHCELWPTKQMSVIAVPTVGDDTPEMLVANARTGAWALYKGWDGTCLETFSDRLFFGSQNGRVVEAEIGGNDEGAPYTATCLPLFSDLGSPASLKTAAMGRAVILSPYPVDERISVQVDFMMSLPPPPSAAPLGNLDIWGAGVWGSSVWGTQTTKKTYQNWRSVSGFGYTMAPAIQITSGSVAPPNVELIRLEITTQAGDIGS